MACAPDPSKKKGLVKTDILWQCEQCPFAISSIISSEDAERHHSTQHPECPSLSAGLESDAVIASSLSSYEVIFRRNGDPREQPREQRQDFEHEIGLIRELWCSICFERWRNVATTTCRHVACCDVCLQRLADRSCTICRGRIRGQFSVKFHSANLLDEIFIPKPSEMRSNSSTEILALVGQFCQMGFQEDRVRRVIQQNMSRSSGTTGQTCALPSEDIILDSLLDPSSASANADEMDSFLKDPQGDIRVKRQISEYLRSVSKCLMCKERPPDICLLPCRHLAVCELCHKDFGKRATDCPDCGKRIGNHVKLHI